MDKHSAKLKSVSLPGYARGFHGVFRNNHPPSVPESGQNSKLAKPDAIGLGGSTRPAAEAKVTDKKKKWGGWGAFFRRNKSGNKKGNSDDSTDSENESQVPAATKRSFLSRKKSKQTEKKVEEDSGGAAIQRLSSQRNMLKDELPSVNAGNSYVSTLYQIETKTSSGVLRQPPTPPARHAVSLDVSGSDLSTSQASLSRREKRDLRFARAAARRAGSHAGSSSSDDDSRSSCRYQSQESLHSRSTLSRRTRSARTDRYIKRKSREEDSLRREHSSQLSISSLLSGENALGNDLKSNGKDSNVARHADSEMKTFPPNPLPRKPVMSPKWGTAVFYEDSNENETLIHGTKTTSSPVSKLMNDRETHSNFSRPPSTSHLNFSSRVSREPSIDRKVIAPPPPPRNPQNKSYLLPPDYYGRPTSLPFGEFRHDYQNIDKDGRVVADRSPNSSGPVNSKQFFPKPFKPLAPTATSANDFQKDPSVTCTQMAPPAPEGPMTRITSPTIAVAPFFGAKNTQSPHPPLSYQQRRLENPPSSLQFVRAPEVPLENPPVSPVTPSNSGSAPVRKTASDFWRARELEQKLLQAKSGITRSESSPSAPVSPYRSPIPSLHSQKPNTFEFKSDQCVIGSAASLISDVPSPTYKDPNGPLQETRPLFKSAHPPPTPKRNVSHTNLQVLQQQQQQQHPIRDLSKLQPSKDENLEQAISELEAVYQSLNLKDEDLSSRPEWNEVPTAQKASRKEITPSNLVASSTSVESSVKTMAELSVIKNTSRQADSVLEVDPLQTKNPVSRRSGIPDRVGDDMASRRLLRRTYSEPNPESALPKSGSYIQISPVPSGMGNIARETDISLFGNTVSVTDKVVHNIREAHTKYDGKHQSQVSNKLGYVLQANDHLEMNKGEKLRSPLDTIKLPSAAPNNFDLQNLSRDGSLATSSSFTTRVNTEKLDDLLEEAQVNKESTLSLRKKRAVRSLSANIAQLIRRESLKTETDCVEDINTEPKEMDIRTQSMSDLFANTKAVKDVDSKSVKTPRAVKQRSEMKKSGRGGNFDDHPGDREAEVTSGNVWDRPHLHQHSYASSTGIDKTDLSDFATSTETLTEAIRPTSSGSSFVPIYPRRTQPIGCNIVDVTAAKEVANTLDHLIADLTSVHQSYSDAKINLHKPPSGLKEEVVPESWEESPLFRAARPSTPQSSDTNSEASCGAQEVQRILRHIHPFTPGRKKSVTPDPGPRLNSTSSMNTGATGKLVGKNEVTDAPNPRTASPLELSKPLRKMSSDETRAERIARYKEERKKQLQARFGASVVRARKDDSSSSEEIQEEHSYTKYKLRKHQQKENVPNSSFKAPELNEGSQDNANNTGHGLDKTSSPATAIKRYIRRESPLSEDAGPPGLVRTNRAARLRAAAAATVASPPESLQETASRTKRPSLSGKKSTTSSSDQVTTVPGPANKDEPCRDEANGTPVVQEVVLRRKLSTQSEKDKSTKRKSNLNRAITEEQVTSPGATIEDTVSRGRRRLRGTDLTASHSSADTDPSSSVDNLNAHKVEKEVAKSEMQLSKQATPTSSQSSEKLVHLRSNLRESAPPFLQRRSASGNELSANATLQSSAGREQMNKSGNSAEKKPFQAAKVNQQEDKTVNEKSTANYPSVPWRSTGKAAAPTSVKAEDITARIEALTAMAKQTVARVDRLAANGKSTPASESKAAPTSERNELRKPVRSESTKSLVSPNEGDDAGKVVHSILKKKSITETVSPVRVRSPEVPKSVVRIRTESEGRPESPEPTSILKRKMSKEELHLERTPGEPHSILKRRSSRDESAGSRSISPEPHSILKRKTKVEPVVPDTDNLEPRPILKKRSSADESSEPRPILKKKSSTDDEHDGEKPKPILKSPRRRSPELLLNPDSESLGIFRRRVLGAEAQLLTEEEQLDPPSAPQGVNHGEDRPPSREAETPATEREVAPWRQNAKPQDRPTNKNSESTRQVVTVPETSAPAVPSTGAIPKRRKSMESIPVEQPIPEVPSLPTATHVTEAVNPNVRLDDTATATETKAPSLELLVDGDSDLKLESSKQPRPSRSRCSTQPVTFEEVHEASKMAAAEIATEQLEKEKPDTEQDSGSSTDDPSKLSLADRVRLFNEKMSQVRAEAPAERVRPTRKKRPQSSRFQTQPITTLEVHRALVNPPAVISFSSASAESTPIGPSNEAAVERNKQGSSDGETKGSDKIRGILRKKSTDSLPEVKGILRSKSPAPKEEVTSAQPRSILKRQSDFLQSGDSGSDSSFEDLSIPPEQNLAAKLLTLEREARLQHSERIDQENGEETRPAQKNTGDESSSPSQYTTPSPIENPTTAVNGVETSDSPSLASTKEELERPAEVSVTDRQEVSVVNAKQESVSRQTVSTQKVTIVHQSSQERSEEENSGTETSTTVILRIESTSQAKSRTDSKMWKKTQVASSTVVEQANTGSIASSKSEESEEDCPSSSSAEVRTTVSLRLAALQKSGELEWRKRLSKIKPDDPEEEIKPTSIANDEAASTIAARLNLLETAQKGWKKRVEETDAIRFTVAGKMGRGSSLEEAQPGSVSSSPLPDRKKKAPRPIKYRGKASEDDGDSKSSPVTPSDEGTQKVPFHRSTSEPDAKEGRSDSRPVSRVVAVPRPDDETFTSFFTSSTTTFTETTTAVTIIEDLDAITTSTEDLMVQRRSVKIQKRKFTSRNPIKTLTARTDLQDEYEEVDTGVVEREMRRIKLEQLAKNSNFAVEALAGLASKEDFTAVTLKTAQNATTCAVYLIHIKGRRHVQTRLVEPVASSVNSGDAYVLVTPTQVFQWMGQYSNVIERAKCADVAQQILLKKDLGCAQATQLTIIDEDKVGSGAWGASKKFWKALGAEGGSAKRPAGPPEEDEIYESAIIDTNMVWSLEGDELVPVDNYWAALPKTDMLLPKKVYVFDLGSEMYVWSGKQAPFEARRKAMLLAKELWDEGYDYTDCEINPLDPASLRNGPRSGKQRYSWTLFSKANQHMEPVLFREKFLDWPDTSRLIKVKSQESEEKGRANVDSNTLVPYDARLMLENVLPEPGLELEGSQVGRGLEYYDSAEKRLNEIVTLSVKTWHILEYDKLLLPEASFGQFHRGDAYIVRWQYRITVTGRDLKGQASKHAVLGRDRCCYFFWHGKDAPPTEQGASALNTIDLDSERGPHVRVVQGREPPAFLALFKGRMIVHRGKWQDENTKKSGYWRMYMIRGERENEACLVEIPPTGHQLRSRGSYLVLNASKGVVYVWHGGKSQKHTRQVALSAANLLKTHRPSELQLKVNAVAVKELYEGAETKDFWEGLGGTSQKAYHSLLDSKKRFDHTLRLFHLTSWTGQFRAEEIASPVKLPQVTSSYPFLQSDLYEANQPALFLVDNQHEVWLWEGWWPTNTDDNDNVRTGSGKLRWIAERKCAYETTLQYCQLKDPQNPPEAYLVTAGLEPLAFKCLFPDWTENEDIAELNLEEGRKAGQQQLVREVLDRLKRTTYSLKELQAKPPPEGVDPTRLESYLTDADFLEAMKMTKDEFYALQAWKQTAIRKEVGLF